MAIIGDCNYWSYPSGRSVRLYTNGCVVDSGTGLMGPCTDVGRQGEGNPERTVEYLLVTKKRLEDELQDLSSDTNVESEERNFKLPPTLGETQMKYLQGLASMGQYHL